MVSFKNYHEKNYRSKEESSSDGWQKSWVEPTEITPSSVSDDLPAGPWKGPEDNEAEEAPNPDIVQDSISDVNSNRVYKTPDPHSDVDPDPPNPKPPADLKI